MSRVSPEWASATVTSHSSPQHQQVHITWHLTLSSLFNHHSQGLEVSLFVFCLSFLFCLAFFLHLRRGNFNVKPHSRTVLTQLCHICCGPLSFFFKLLFYFSTTWQMICWAMDVVFEEVMWTTVLNMSRQLQSRVPDAPTHLQWAAHHCKSPDVKINEMLEFEWGNMFYLVT